MSSYNWWFLLGRSEEGEPLFWNLLRNILSCYFLPAFEFTLQPVPFTGAGWKVVEDSQHVLRGHAPYTCSFLLIKTGHKGTESEEENSQSFFPLLTISSVSGIFLHYWLCHMISCRTPPTRIVPRLGPRHPPACCLRTQKRRPSFGEPFTVSKNSAWDRDRESCPMKLASLSDFCIKVNYFPNTTGHATKRKITWKTT